MKARGTSGKRWLALPTVALSLVGIQLLISIFASVPGFLVIDEVLYDWMARDFAATGNVALVTGYSETPSPELVYSRHTELHDGKVYPQYPPFFPALSYPFFRLFRFRGLILANSLAFIGVVLLTFGTARQLFGDRRLALLSTGVLVLATFAWEYSQHAWPHSTAMLFSTGAVYLVARAWSRGGRVALLSALAAGLMAGVGIGVRLEVVFLIPCLVLPFAFARPMRWLEALAVLAGTLPGFVLLALVNKQKFGTLNPLSYGNTTPPVSPGIVLVCGAGLVVLWLASRLPESARGVPWRALGYVVAALGTVAVLASPSMSANVARYARSLYAFTIDLRSFSTTVPMPAMSRGPGGEVIYIDSLKKALLQSLPYLTLLALPLLHSLRRSDEAARLRFLLLVPATVAAALGAFSFHGGLCLNMRYFLPVLPFTSILVAWAVLKVFAELSSRPRPQLLSLIALGVAGSTLAALRAYGRSPGQEARVVLDTPLAIALVVLVLTLAFAAAGGRAKQRVGRVLVLAVAVALAWSATIAFCYDYPRHRRQRLNNLDIGTRTAELIPDGSLFFTAPYVDPFMKLLDRPGVRIAFPDQDAFADLPRLVAENLGAGHRVFGVLRLGEWDRLHEGALEPYEIRPVWWFLERYDFGPTLHSLGPYPAVGVRSASHGFLLAEVTEAGHGSSKIQ